MFKFLGVPANRKYVVQLQENIYMEADSSKEFRDYPNAAYPSYRDCDNQFMKDYIYSFDPPGMVPIWLTDNMQNVTTHMRLKSFGKNCTLRSNL